MYGLRNFLDAKAARTKRNHKLAKLHHLSLIFGAEGINSLGITNVISLRHHDIELAWSIRPHSPSTNGFERSPRSLIRLCKSTNVDGQYMSPFVWGSVTPGR